MLAVRHDIGGSRSAPLGAADWLCLTATPAFAIVALLTAIQGGAPDMVCSAGGSASPLGGMVPMYLLMSVFHAAPWLRLIAGRRAAAAAAGRS